MWRKENRRNLRMDFSLNVQTYSANWIQYEKYFFQGVVYDCRKAEWTSFSWLLGRLTFLYLNISPCKPTYARLYRRRLHNNRSISILFFIFRSLAIIKQRAKLNREDFSLFTSFSWLFQSFSRDSALPLKPFSLHVKLSDLQRAYKTVGIIKTD